MAKFISDMKMTPLHLCLQLSPAFDCVSWIELKMGERDVETCSREPSNRWYVAKRYQSIDWFYRVGFGERET